MLSGEVQLTRSGMAGSLVSVPSRYMHPQAEIVSIRHLENTARLLATFLKSVSGKADFTSK